MELRHREALRLGTIGIAVLVALGDLASWVYFDAVCGLGENNPEAARTCDSPAMWLAVLGAVIAGATATGAWSAKEGLRVTALGVLSGVVGVALGVTLGLVPWAVRWGWL